MKMTDKEILSIKKTLEIVRAKRCNSFDDSLPIADRGTAWDAGKATKNMENLATGSDGKINFEKFKRGFLWYDSSNSELVGSYKLPIADVMGGRLHVIPKALIAVLGRLDQTNIPSEDKDKVRNVVAKYYKKMGMEMPS